MHDDPAIRSDPQAFIAAPVLAALNRIALAAVIGFGVVAGWATLPLLLPIGEEFHQAFHFGLPIAWTLFAATVAASLLLHPAPVEPDVWVRAMQVDAGQARFARTLSAVMLAGWLLSVAVVVVNHHLDTPRDALYGLGVMVPLTLAAYILAAVAFNAWCRASLSRAEHVSSERFRRYWVGVAHGRQQS
jgi:hypothetical protein